MATAHGRAGFFSWNNGSPRDLSAFLTDVSLNQKTDDVDTTTFTSSSTPSKSFLLGFTEREIALSGLYDPTATTGPDAVLNADLGGTTARVWIYDPGGTASGQAQYTGSGFITKYNVKGSVGSAVAFECTIKVTGAVTRTTL